MDIRNEKNLPLPAMVYQARAVAKLVNVYRWSAHVPNLSDK